MLSYDDVVQDQIAQLLSSDQRPARGHVPNRGPAFQAISITLYGLATVFVALRTYGRIRVKRQRKLTTGVGADDYLALAALTLAGGLTATIVTAIRFGLGKHIQDQTNHGLTIVLKMIYGAIILIIICMTALRCSILCLYLRVTPVRSHRIIIWTVLAVTTMHSIAAVLATIFQCVPISLNWNAVIFLSVEKPNCINIFSMNVANAVASLIWDITIWLLPTPVIYRLNAPTPKKVGIFVVIAISGFSIACAALSMKALMDFRKSIDIIWTLATAIFVSLVEICVALITSSVPVIYPLFVKPRASSKTSNNSKSSNSQSKTRWPNQSVRGPVAPSPKTHGGWRFGWAGGTGNHTEMDVIKKGTLNTFHEIPSTASLHEPGNSSGKGHDEIEVRWKPVSD